jgi:hypothetical protein
MAVTVESITAILQEQVTEAVQRLGDNRNRKNRNDEGDQYTLAEKSSVLQLEARR